MVEARHGRLHLFPGRRDDRPEGERDLLVGGYPDPSPQRRNRIEREALIAGKFGARIESGGIGDGAAPPEEGSPVGLGLRLAP